MAGGWLLACGKAAFQELTSTTALLEQAAQATGENLSGKPSLTTWKQLEISLKPSTRPISKSFSHGLLSAIYLLNPEVLVLGEEF